MNAKLLTQADLTKLAADLLAAGTRVIAPARDASGRVDYRAIANADEANFGDGLPGRGLKEFFLPATEVLLRWKYRKKDIELEEVATTFAPQVVLGARPCDAAAVETLDKVMGWDYRDELWFGRREATTIVTLACAGGDASCFCGSVGLAPDSKRGSDVMLTPAQGGWRAEALTAKGEALLGKAGGAAATAEPAANKATAPKLREPLPAQFPAWLAENFEHPYWKTIALRCHGCGACASVCPTCHCFDIVDEPEGIDSGARRCNWDTCQTAKFTLHASGHNPRAAQNERFRQRVMHKFSIYPQKFGELLCTGCGRCARACPGGMDLPEVLGDLARLAAAGAATGGAK